MSQISRDADFEYAVRRRIGHHDRREIGAMRLGLGLQIAQDRRCRRSSHATTTTFMPAMLRRRRIGAVRRGRNQAHVAHALRLARRDTRLMISSPAYSPCEPALGCSETAA